MKRLFALLVILSLASIATAGEIFLPATYRGEGAGGSVWRTEIVVTNVSSILLHEPQLATITLHRADGSEISVPMLLSVNEVIAVPDALRDWFNVESGGGLVRITWENPEARIAARARIYNVSSGGEYGQGVPAVRLDRLESIAYLPGLTGVGGNRTNIGVSNPHDFDALVWIMLYDTAGNERGAFATSIPARSYRQFNDIFSYFQAGPLNAAMVQVSSQQATIYAWASIVRDDTGDATFVTPVR